jgi:hypothetical protein
MGGASKCHLFRGGDGEGEIQDAPGRWELFIARGRPGLKKKLKPPKGVRDNYEH